MSNINEYSSINELLKIFIYHTKCCYLSYVGILNYSVCFIILFNTNFLVS